MLILMFWQRQVPWYRALHRFLRFLRSYVFEPRAGSLFAAAKGNYDVT